jgi:hypothetical protein
MGTRDDLQVSRMTLRTSTRVIPQGTIRVDEDQAVDTPVVLRHERAGVASSVRSADRDAIPRHEDRGGQTLRTDRRDSR